MLSATKYVSQDPETNLHSYSVYALVSGILGIIIGVAMRIFMKMVSQQASALILRVGSGFLSAYWVIGACIMTFRAPFVQLGNGYIAVYATAFFSVTLFLQVLPGDRKQQIMESFDEFNSNIRNAEGNKRWIALCLFSSIVEVIEASIFCHDFCQNDSVGSLKQLSGYAVAVGVLSFLMCLILLVPSVPDGVKGPVQLVLALWWTAALIALTFASFTFSTITMNGYLSTWAATIATYGMVLPFFAALPWFQPDEPFNDYDELGGDNGYNNDDGLGHDDSLGGNNYGSGGV